MNLGRWAFFHPTWTDLSRFCHVSRHSGQEALNRIMELTWMETRATAEETQSEDTILEIAEANALALTLGIGMPIILEDLDIETAPWKFAPDRPNFMLMKMATPSWTHSSVAASVRFHASFLLRRKKDDPFTENITFAELQRVQNWHSILNNVPESIFSLQNILRGSCRKSWFLFKVGTSLLTIAAQQWTTKLIDASCCTAYPISKKLL